VPKRTNHKANHKLQKTIEQAILERLAGTVIENFATKVDEVASRKLKKPALEQKIERLTARILYRVLEVN